MAKQNAEGQKKQPLSQMTIKNCGCDPRQAIRDGKQVFMIRIFGEATASKTKEARNGDEYTYLIGSFRGVRPSLTPQEKADFGAEVIFESDKLFLPSTLQEKIEATLATSKNAVQFGYDIYSTPDKDVTVGYRYAAAAIVDTQATDRLDAMAESLTAKALPGSVKPKKDAAKS